MFHGKRMRSYEHIIVEEVMREIATWPEDRDFETLPSMTSITLGAILRAVFGPRGRPSTSFATCYRRWSCLRA